MKLICNGLDLSDAVLKVVKAVSSKQTNPILEGIKLTASKDTLTLLATDTELSIETSIRADILIEGAIVVPGKYFSDFIKKLDKEHIELSFLEGQLKIKYEDSDSMIQTMPADDFPVIDRDIDESSFTINQREFRDMVNKTAFSCCQDDSRPILKGCLLEIEDGLITCVALDGFRLAVAKKNIAAMSKNQRIICPQRALLEICRILEKDDEDITVTLKKNILKVESDNTCVTARLLEGEFINYKNIIPKDFMTGIVVNTQLFLQSVERASILARQDRYNLIKLDIREKHLSVISNSAIGNVNEIVPINLEGKDLTISLNSRYILEALRTVNEEYIRMNFNSSVSPCIIAPLSGEEFLYLILPVRTAA